MALGAKAVVDGGVSGEEPLSGGKRHSPASSTHVIEWFVSRRVV